MRRTLSLMLALVFLAALMPSAFAVETKATRRRAASRSKVYKNRKAPKSSMQKHRARKTR